MEGVPESALKAGLVGVLCCVCCSSEDGADTVAVAGWCMRKRRFFDLAVNGSPVLSLQGCSGGSHGFARQAPQSLYKPRGPLCPRLGMPEWCLSGAGLQLPGAAEPGREQRSAARCPRQAGSWAVVLCTARLEETSTRTLLLQPQII